MVPLYHENGQLAVRVRAHLVWNGPVNETHTVFSGFMTLKANEHTSLLTTEGTWGMFSQLTFLGSNDAGVLSTRGISPLILHPMIGRRNFLGFHPASDIYREFPQGFMLYPGRSNNEFPDDTKVSMILDQSILEDGGLCYQTSLFHITRELNSVYVETLLVQDGSPVEDILPTQTLDTYAIDPYPGMLDVDESYRDTDVISFRVGAELVNYFFPQRSSSLLPQYLDNCDLVNGDYPSIHFRILEPPSSGGTHRGTIVYSPVDYMESTGDGRCRFTVRNFGVPRFGMNFLTKVAIHFKADEIGFCDPA
jgi:hypothetical protein